MVAEIYLLRYPKSSFNYETDSGEKDFSAKLCIQAIVYLDREITFCQDSRKPGDTYLGIALLLTT